MEHRCDADLNSKRLRVAGKHLQGLGSSLEQQPVERLLIDAQQRVELMRQGKDDVEVGHWEQQRLLPRQPLCPGSALAFGAVTIAAGVGADPLRPTGVTSLDVPSEGCRAALGDGA
jgi:hypothetical protein